MGSHRGSVGNCSPDVRASHSCEAVRDTLSGKQETHPTVPERFFFSNCLIGFEMKVSVSTHLVYVVESSRRIFVQPRNAPQKGAESTTDS